MKKFFLVTTALAALAAPAAAADLPVKAFGAAIAPVPSIWAGCFASMETASVGGEGISGGPGAGAAMECLSQSGSFVYSMGLDALFTKLSTPGASSPLTMSADVKAGLALHPGAGTFGMIPFNDVWIYGGAALPASVIDGLGGTSMQTGWMIKAGLATALTYNAAGQVQTSFGPEYRFTRINGQDANTLMFTLSTRM